MTTKITHITEHLEGLRRNITKRIDSLSSTTKDWPEAEQRVVDKLIFDLYDTSNGVFVGMMMVEQLHRDWFCNH